MATFVSLKFRLPEALALSLVLAPHSQSSSPMRSNTSQRDDAENSDPGPSLNSPIYLIKPILLDHFPSIASRNFNRHCHVFFYEIRLKGYEFLSRESEIQVEEHRAVSNQHSQVYADGSICLDILQNQWSPIYDVPTILTSIQSLLCDPNPNSPANSEAALLFNENKREYNRRVHEVVEQSWTAD